MEALILTVFVSLVLSALAVGLFVWDVRQGGHDHHDRLSLLPLESPAAPRQDKTVGVASTPHNRTRNPNRNHKGDNT